ncbi:MAG: SDR family NAD(P)-dependent oxidoreductase, partial [Tatlockia sp.]|nr:SDR family NAD(P)-dependent oxidoreductase [Tatlockia sp.]
LPQSEVIDLSNKHLDAIKQAWLEGKHLNWIGAYEGENLRKVVLPPPPLQLESYWISGVNQSEEKKSKQPLIHTDVKKFLYHLTWRQKIISPSIGFETLQPILIIDCYNDPLIAGLISQLEAMNISCYLLTPGESQKKISTNHWQFNIAAPKLLDLLEHLWAQNSDLPLSCIINIKFLTLNEETNYPINVLFNLIKHNKLIRHLKQLSILVKGMTSLHLDEPQSLSSMLIGFNRSIGQEFPNLKTQLVDLDVIDEMTQISQAIASICSPELNDLCVWRDGACYQQEYQPQPASITRNDYFKKGGVYLITGGLGDVASVHIDFLSKIYQAKLILLGRTTIPDPQEWQNHTALDKQTRQKIARLQQWQTEGVDIRYYSGDIVDLEQMRLLCQRLIKEFGKIDGVVHCAGVGSEMHYKVLGELDWQHCWQLIKPKLLGIETIGTLTKELGIKDCLIISSISSALTGIGLGAYGASHNILDAMVRKNYPHWRLINWDAWNFYQEQQAKQYGELGSEIDKLAIKPEVGFDILCHAFSIPYWQQLFISCTDLTARFNYWAQRGFLEKMTRSSKKHPRPNLHTEYIAPSTPLQKNLATSWQSLLGIEKVGIQDSFFELGGHSLLALEFMNCLQTEFLYSCSIVELFESPTIMQLATKMEQLESTSDNLIANANDRVGKQIAARHRFQPVKESFDVQK